MADINQLDLYDISKGILDDRERIQKSISVVWKLAQEKSDAEYEYKKAYAIQIEQLRIEKNPATLIKELAEGQVADKRRAWELANGQYRAALASLEALQTSMQALQSMLRYLDKV